MALESQNTSDAPPHASLTDGVPACKPIDANDRALWRGVVARVQSDGHSTMAGLGLADFQLHPAGGHSTATERQAKRPEFTPFVMPARPESWVKPEVKADVSLTDARNKLEDALLKRLPASHATQFRQDMERFEARAQKDHLSPQQIADTYQSLEQLLNAKNGPLSQSDRQTLASQVIALAADPNKAVTGIESQTCGPVQLETLIYQRSPERAANLVAQVAMSGSYRSVTGTTVNPDLLPTGESQAAGDYHRLFASQIFQTTALDTNLKQLDSHLTYHHAYGAGEGGENSEYYSDERGNRIKFDGTYAGDLTNIYHEITGKKDLVVIQGGKGVNTDNLKFVTSQAQLKTVLNGLRAQGNPPTILGVDSRNQPFWDQQYTGAPPGNEDPNDPHYHWIALKDYDAQSDTISYHDGWDDPDHKINNADLFRGTQYADAALQSMSHDFMHSLSMGNGNWAEAIDALRIRSETGRISDRDLAQLFKRDLEQLIRQRGKHALDDASTRKNILELRNYLVRRNALTLTPDANQLITTWEESHQDG